MSIRATHTRRCYRCKVRIVRDPNDPKKTYTEPVCTAHCVSPTCDYCTRCHIVKMAELRGEITPDLGL